MKKLILLLALIATTITTAQVSTANFNYIHVQNETTGVINEGYTNTTVTLGSVEADVVIDAFGSKERYNIVPYTTQTPVIQGRQYSVSEGYNLETNQKVLIIATKDGTFGLKEGVEWVSFYNK